MGSIYAILHDIFAPGLLASPQVETALVAGTIVSIISAVVGLFVVIRGQAFLGHALGDMGATGASAASLVGIQALWGFLAGGLVAGTAADAFSVRSRERDITTGVVLAFTLGLGVLFLYLITRTSDNTGLPMTILFGSLFTVDPSVIPIMIVTGLAALGLVAALYRPLLFSTLTPDTARARGIPIATVNVLFLIAVVVAVEQGALIVGSLLSTALLVGPAATAIRLSRRIGWALAVATGLSTAVTWLGVVLAYDSYSWPPQGRGWPISFFISSLILLVYLATLLRPRSISSSRAI